MRTATLVISCLVLLACANGDDPDPVASRPGPGERTTHDDAGRRDLLIRSFLTLGDQAFERTEYGKAVECFRRALELDPGNADARRGYRRTLAALGHRVPLETSPHPRPDRSEKIQAKITECVLAAERHEASGEFRLALQQFEKAILIHELSPYAGEFRPPPDEIRKRIAGLMEILADGK